jgi:HTH-type transcriptional regulator/antitoxin HipB
MIKTKQQAAFTAAKINELKKAKEEFIKENAQLSDIEYQFRIDSFDGLIDDLEAQLNEYEYLKNGNFHCFKAKSLEELPKLIISARIAQSITQKQLAERLGVAEQQIQRYESVDYQSISLDRLMDIIDALGLTITFSDVIIIGSGPRFMIPSGLDDATIYDAENATKLSGSLIV